MMFPLGYGNGVYGTMLQPVVQNDVTNEASTVIVPVIPMAPIEKDIRELKAMVLKFMNKDGLNLLLTFRI